MVLRCLRSDLWLSLVGQGVDEGQRLDTKAIPTATVSCDTTEPGSSAHHKTGREGGTAAGSHPALGACPRATALDPTSPWRANPASHGFLSQGPPSGAATLLQPQQLCLHLPEGSARSPAPGWGVAPRADLGKGGGPRRARAEADRNLLEEEFPFTLQPPGPSPIARDRGAGFRPRKR